MLIKRVTIFLIISFWFVFGLWNVLDLRLKGLFYLPVIGILPFVLMGVQDQSVWHLDEQALTWIQDFALLFVASMLAGEIRIHFFKNALLPFPPSSETPQIK